MVIFYKKNYNNGNLKLKLERIEIHWMYQGFINVIYQVPEKLGHNILFTNRTNKLDFYF